MPIRKINSAGGDTSAKKNFGRNAALPLNFNNLAKSGHSRTLSAEGLGSKICRIILSKPFPVEKLTFSGLFEYLEGQQKHVLSKGSTADEKKALMSLSLLDPDVEVFLFPEAIEKKLGKSGITDFHRRYEYIGAITREARLTLKQLEPVMIPPDRYCVRLTTEHFGKGYQSFLDKIYSRYPGRLFNIITKNFFDQCLYAEKRIFAAEWEKDYAEILACLTAAQLHKEWLRVASLIDGENVYSPLYRSTVRLFNGDGLNYISPCSMSVISAERLYLENMFPLEELKPLVFRSVALADVYLEWASRHWKQDFPENRYKNALNAAKIDLADYMNKFLLPFSSETPFEQRPVVKIFKDSSCHEALDFLKPQDIQR